MRHLTGVPATIRLHAAAAVFVASLVPELLLETARSLLGLEPRPFDQSMRTQPGGTHARSAR